MKKFLVMMGFVILVTGCGSNVKEASTSTHNEPLKDTFIDEGALQGEIKEFAKVINLQYKYRNEHNSAAYIQLFTTSFISRHEQSRFNTYGIKYLAAKIRTSEGSYTANVIEKTLYSHRIYEGESMYVLKKENGKWLINIVD